MRGRLWLGLAWLLLARAPGAAGTPSSPRRPRSYPHLEGDVRWRRLLSSTHFFLRVDPGGRVQGTRWRHGADSEFGEGVRGRQSGRKDRGGGRSKDEPGPLSREGVWCQPSHSPAGASVSSTVKWVQRTRWEGCTGEVGVPEEAPHAGLAPQQRKVFAE